MNTKKQIPSTAESDPKHKYTVYSATFWSDTGPYKKFCAAESLEEALGIIGVPVSRAYSAKVVSDRALMDKALNSPGRCFIENAQGQVSIVLTGGTDNNSKTATNSGASSVNKETLESEKTPARSPVSTDTYKKRKHLKFYTARMRFIDGAGTLTHIIEAMCVSPTKAEACARFGIECTAKNIQTFLVQCGGSYIRASLKDRLLAFDNSDKTYRREAPLEGGKSFCRTQPWEVVIDPLQMWRPLGTTTGITQRAGGRAISTLTFHLKGHKHLADREYLFATQGWKDASRLTGLSAGTLQARRLSLEDITPSEKQMCQDNYGTLFEKKANNTWAWVKVDWNRLHSGSFKVQPEYSQTVAEKNTNAAADRLKKVMKNAYKEVPSNIAAAINALDLRGYSIEVEPEQANEKSASIPNTVQSPVSALPDPGLLPLGIVSAYEQLRGDMAALKQTYIYFEERLGQLERLPVQMSVVEGDEGASAHQLEGKRVAFPLFESPPSTTTPSAVSGLKHLPGPKYYLKKDLSKALESPKVTIAQIISSFNIKPACKKLGRLLWNDNSLAEIKLIIHLRSKLWSNEDIKQELKRLRSLKDSSASTAFKTFDTEGQGNLTSRLALPPAPPEVQNKHASAWAEPEAGEENYTEADLAYRLNTSRTQLLEWLLTYNIKPTRLNPDLYDRNAFHALRIVQRLSQQKGADDLAWFLGYIKDATDTPLGFISTDVSPENNVDTSVKIPEEIPITSVADLVNARDGRHPTLAVIAPNNGRVVFGGKKKLLYITALESLKADLQAVMDRHDFHQLMLEGNTVAGYGKTYPQLMVSFANADPVVVAEKIHPDKLQQAQTLNSAAEKSTPEPLTVFKVRKALNTLSSNYLYCASETLEHAAQLMGYEEYEEYVNAAENDPDHTVLSICRDFPNTCFERTKTGVKRFKP